MAHQQYGQGSYEGREGQESWRQDQNRDSRYGSGRGSYETETFGRQRGVPSHQAGGYGHPERGGGPGQGEIGPASYGGAGGSSAPPGGSDLDWDRRSGGGAYLSAQGGGWDQSDRGHGQDYGRDSGRYGQGYGRSGWQGGGQGYGQGQGRPYSDGSGQHDRNVLQRGGDEVASWFDDERQDQRGQGHRGKGPQGYSRSDQRIQDDVNDRLSDDDQVDASGIRVKVENGEVTLDGEVDSKQSKRLAEDCVDRVSGVKHVQNNLRVRQQGLAQQANQSAGQNGGAAGQGAVLAGMSSGPGSTGSVAGHSKSGND